MQMVKCPSCNEENPAKFRLCGYCGTALAPAAAASPPKEVRKTVTLLFTDLKDSTALGERLDSEALHEVKERYFGAMAAEIQRHGGKIEKYIGDAIMAVFGLPRAHEDDALRAVRSAVGMQQVLKGLNEELKTRFGVTLANRTGVNTGEVVATDDPTRDQKLATGDAVNVTARLEAAAPPNEIYIGEVTYRLVRDAVQAEAVEPLRLKGKSEPVPAFRLVSVHGEDGNVRRHDTPVVGRDAELSMLEAAWQEVVTHRRARLVTVVGDAGVGKTRLVREIMERLSARSRMISGRCLPYGEGITFWPLRGMVVAAAGIREDDTPDVAIARILDCVGDQDVVDRLASAMGLNATAFPLHEINWGARKFFQRLASASPVVALFDDIHWAEPAFLDLMENLLETVDGAAFLMLATSRHELLESRADWSDREGARRLVLKPLGDEAVAQVVSNLLGAAGLPANFISRVVTAAEGNPLYVEQMLSMLKDTGVVRLESGNWVAAKVDGEIAIPPTIQALLEARLDKLDRGERAAAEPASVIGLEFARPAVESLSPVAVREAIDEKLQSLSRKHFIRPSVSAEGDARYRFDHHLVRETVYNGLLKRARATLHFEFVKWADQLNAGSDRGQEFEEILGYHLEQAYKYLRELGPIDEAGAAIGRDAAGRLSSAGRRAFGRGDLHAAAGLFRRAVALFAPDDAARVPLVQELGEVLSELGAFVEARAVLDDAQASAERIGNRRIAISAALIRMRMRLYGDESGVDSGESALQLAEGAIPLFESEGAHHDLARAWRLIALVHGISARYQKSTDAINQSMKHARLVGDDRIIARNVAGLCSSALLGPAPVSEAISLCNELIAEGLTDRQAESRTLCTLAQLHAMNGDFEKARLLYRRGRGLLTELGKGLFAAGTGIDLLTIESLAGDLAVAEREVMPDYEFLEKAGEKYRLSTIAALLSRVIRDQGRDEDAMKFSEVAERITPSDDVDSQALWRSIRAPILARRGQIDEALELARSAVQLCQQSDAPQMRADALLEFASVQYLAGEVREARRTAEEAVRLYAAKGDVVSASKAKVWTEELKEV